MNTATVGTTRHLFSLVFGGFVATGLASNNELEAVISGLLALLNIGWMWWSKRQEGTKPEKATGPKVGVFVSAVCVPVALGMLVGCSTISQTVKDGDIVTTSYAADGKVISKVERQEGKSASTKVNNYFQSKQGIGELAVRNTKATQSINGKDISQESDMGAQATSLAKEVVATAANAYTLGLAKGRESTTTTSSTTPTAIPSGAVPVTIKTVDGGQMWCAVVDGKTNCWFFPTK